jgi:acetate kinase
MNVLVINCGSSSIKYGLYEMPGDRLLGRGKVDRIAHQPAEFEYEDVEGEQHSREVAVDDHAQGARMILDHVLNGGNGPISGGRVEAVGHRIVHGGDVESQAVFIDNNVMDRIERFAPMAPLHNPPALAAMRTVMEIVSDVPHVACFDTAFHRTIPDAAFMYALPRSFHDEHAVRRYGFHGISFRFVCERAAALLDLRGDELNAVACHLGNGCSIAAVRHGRSIDTSMGMTPLEGLVMGTRAGDIDPGILFHLIEKGFDPAELERIMNAESGLLGLSGVSRDVRDVLQAAGQGNEDAQLAVRVFCYRLKKYIGAYIAVLGQPHAVIFTGGIGENAASIRGQTCADMHHLGIDMDAERNRAAVGTEADITADTSRVRVLVIPTNEELAIAADTYRLLARQSSLAVG